MNTTGLRALPYSRDAEQLVVGGIFLFAGQPTEKALCEPLVNIAFERNKQQTKGQSQDMMAVKKAPFVANATTQPCKPCPRAVQEGG